MMKNVEQTVYIVDDDEAARAAVELLLNAVGLTCQTFSSAAAFLDVCDSDCNGCLLLDFLMPGMSGVELQNKLLADDIHLPIIFISGHGDIPMVVAAMRRGAYDFVCKPYREHELLTSIKGALALQANMREHYRELSSILKNLNTLTEREREVLDCIAAGQSNRVTARELLISDRTVETYRAHIMEKMKVESVAQLVRISIIAETALDKRSHSK